MSAYSITQTSSTVYLDNRGQAVQGFLLLVHLQEYDEILEVRVPNLKDGTVKNAVSSLVKERDALAKLGSETSKDAK